MPDITMYLTIESRDHFGSGTIYRKVMQTSFLPTIGSRVVLFPSNVADPDPNDGPEGSINRVWWGVNGSVSLQFEHYVVDPDEHIAERAQESWNSNHPLHAWYTDQDGDLAAQLITAGWRADW